MARYLSLFSGIEAATVAWHPLGWECVGVAEIEPFPCAVLAHHYPDVPNLGSVTEITEAQIKALGHIDVVVFGSPCQDLSVAGHRKGLINADGTVTRSGLFFTAINIARWSGARFWLWENVPGAFSSNKGRDFASVVEFMAGLDDVPVPDKWWGTEGVAVGDNGLLEWGVLDAQWFGVAQRRRRVFALLDTGDWANRPPILLEPEGVRGDSAPRRKTGEEVAGTIAARFGVSRNNHEECVPVGFAKQRLGEYIDGDIASTCSARDYKDATDLVAQRYLGNAEGGAAAVPFLTCHNTGGTAGISNQTPLVGVAIAPSLTATNDPSRSPQSSEVTQQVAAVYQASMQVRRLTPVECSRLQGFPDDYLSQVTWRGKSPPPDGPMYKALGNSMAVPVMRWIGEKIQKAMPIDLFGAPI